MAAACLGVSVVVIGLSLSGARLLLGFADAVDPAVMGHLGLQAAAQHDRAAKLAVFLVVAAGKHPGLVGLAGVVDEDGFVHDRFVRQDRAEQRVSPDRRKREPAAGVGHRPVATALALPRPLVGPLDRGSLDRPAMIEY